jgi:1-aminocyclopropane-1-carboxylate deaminase
MNFVPGTEPSKPILQLIDRWKDFQVNILRDDLVHPYLSGNKWRKLKYNLSDFRTSGKKTVVTFGGAYSNHLVATAAASKIFSFESIGIVRGEKVSNDYLNFIEGCGMKLLFINRNDYRLKDDPEFVQSFLKKSGMNADECFMIPEGGSNEAAVKGVSEIFFDIGETDFVLCACGTGTTLAGIARTLKPGQKAIGITVLKAPGYIENQVKLFNGNCENVIVFDDYHFGGYAKSNAELEVFCKSFTGHTKIPIEPVYTGKAFYALEDLLKKNYFEKGSRITVVHTGGIFDFTTPLLK